MPVTAGAPGLGQTAELDAGLGGVTWWGFSPGQVLPGEKVLVVGAGDPRHLVTTIAGKAQGQGIKFFVLEQRFEVYCRQVDPIGLRTDPGARL